MIQPDTISSFGSEDKVPETRSAPSSQPSSGQDMVVPSTSGLQGKKLTCKTNQSDRVLAYLKASVSCSLLTCLILVGCLISSSEAHPSHCRTKLRLRLRKKTMYIRGNSLVS